MVFMALRPSACSISKRAYLPVTPGLQPAEPFGISDKTMDRKGGAGCGRVDVIQRGQLPFQAVSCRGDSRMTEPITARQFHFSTGVDDWRPGGRARRGAERPAPPQA